jgi:hypothetical protein
METTRLCGIDVTKAHLDVAVHPRNARPQRRLEIFWLPELQIVRKCC